MINFNDEFVMTFSLGSVSDFIDTVDLLEFHLYESAGNIRPTLNLKFKLRQEELIRYLNPGNILTLSFGRRELDKDILQFELLGDDTQIQYTLGYTVEIRAAFYKPKFTQLFDYEYFENKTSLEVIKQIAKDNNFNFKTNLSLTNDKQQWYRESDTQWNFIKYVWLHSYLNDDTFFVFGFDCDNMYFYDMKKLISSGPKWVVTNIQNSADSKSTTITVPGYQAYNRYGDVSDLVGKNLKISVYDVDKGELELQNYKLKSLTAIETNKLNINSTNSIDYDYGIISDDVHSNFIKAYNQNVRNNLMYQTFEITSVTGGEMKKYHLLDTVTFNMVPYDIRLQGIAVITAIAYHYTPGDLKMTLTFNKEAPSGIIGDNLQRIN